LLAEHPVQRRCPETSPFRDTGDRCRDKLATPHPYLTSTRIRAVSPSIPSITFRMAKDVIMRDVGQV